MDIIQKRTRGFVIQQYDVDDKEFVYQEFVQEDDGVWEDLNGNPTTGPSNNPECHFFMMQPEDYREK
jgi:hypothetical protein